MLSRCGLEIALRLYSKIQNRIFEFAATKRLFNRRSVVLLRFFFFFFFRLFSNRIVFPHSSYSFRLCIVLMRLPVLQSTSFFLRISFHFFKMNIKSFNSVRALILQNSKLYFYLWRKFLKRILLFVENIFSRYRIAFIAYTQFHVNFSAFLFFFLYWSQ